MKKIELLKLIYDKISWEPVVDGSLKTIDFFKQKVSKIDFEKIKAVRKNRKAVSKKGSTILPTVGKAAKSSAKFVANKVNNADFSKAKAVIKNGATRVSGATKASFGKIKDLLEKRQQKKQNKEYEVYKELNIPENRMRAIDRAIEVQGSVEWLKQHEAEIKLEEKKQKKKEAKAKAKEKKEKQSKGKEERLKKRQNRTTAQKVAPLAMAFLPGGLGLAVSMMAMQQQARAAELLQTEVARLELIENIKGIDGKALSDAQTFASDVSEQAYNNALNIHQDEAVADMISWEAYLDTLCGKLGLTREQYAIIEPTLEQAENHLYDNWDEISNSMWQYKGFDSAQEAREHFQPLIDAYLAGDEAAAAQLETLADEWHNDTIQIFVVDKVQAVIDNLAMQNIVYTDPTLIESVSDVVSVNPEFGAACALGIIGASAVGYCAAKYAADKHAAKQSEKVN